MKQALRLLWQSSKVCSAIIWGFSLWSLWLVLGALLTVQLYVVSTNELALPAMALRQIEDHLADSGLRVTFSRTSFDPTGRVLIENVRATLPEFAEPVFAARAVYCRLNPWMLAVGRFEPREIRVMDASAYVPAMLSRSGQPEEIVRNVEATIFPGARQYDLQQFSARVAGVVVSARGIVPAPHLADPDQKGFATWIAGNFPSLCRQAIAVSDQLADFEQPSLQLEITPAGAGAAMIDVLLLARRARLEIPVAADARDVQVSTRTLLQGEPSTARLEFAAAEIHLPFGTTARRVQAVILGGFRPGGGFRFEPRQFDVVADSIARGGFSAAALSAEIVPRPLPRLDGSLVAQVAGAPLAIQAAADFNARTADIRFRGAVSPGILTPLSERLGLNIRRYFDFESLHCEMGSARLGADWKFEQLQARVGVHKVLAYGVRLDEGKAAITFDGRHFSSTETYARIGSNFARGSYGQDLTSHQFRFLLDGQLRPLDISGWFRPWWSNFFRGFEFPHAPPVASVDVQGVWGDGRRSAVFVLADASKPILRGAAFDQLHTRLFIRPGFYDGLEFSATRDRGAIEGTFTYTMDLDSRGWRRLELNLKSTIGLDLAARTIGPGGTRFFAPYVLGGPPEIALRGHFDGPASPGGRHQSVDATVRTTGELRFHQFPVRDASFSLKIRDDEITVDDLETHVAGGVARGRARVWGSEGGRRVGFDLALNDASLGESAVTLQEFLARRRGEPPAPTGKFVQEKANVRVDLAASSEGAYGDPFSYHGSGNVVFRGAEIGAVPLFGALSDLLKFTTLRFTEARGTFKVEGPKLVFSEFNLRGSNSAIDAHGAYALDKQQLDFSAKIFPFQESGNLVKTVVGAVLSPISNAMEVRLSGSLEKPEWGLSILGSAAPGTVVGTERPTPALEGAVAAPTAPTLDKQALDTKN